MARQLYHQEIYIVKPALERIEKILKAGAKERLERERAESIEELMDESYFNFTLPSCYFSSYDDLF